MRHTIEGGYPAGVGMTKHRITERTIHTTSTKSQHPQPHSQMHLHLIFETLLIATSTFSTCCQEFPSNWPMVKNAFLSSSSSWLSTQDFVYTSLFWGTNTAQERNPSDFGESHRCLSHVPLSSCLARQQVSLRLCACGLFKPALWIALFIGPTQFLCL